MHNTSIDGSSSGNITRIARVVIQGLLSTFQSLATKHNRFYMAYEFQCHGVFYEAIMLSRKHLKFKNSQIGRREGITSEILLSKNF